MSKRTIILTGANRGLGRKTAEILLGKYGTGFRYVFTERKNNDEELRSALQKINGDAEFAIKQLDITDKESRHTFSKWISQNYGTVDVIYNNAGIFDKSNDIGKIPSRKVAETTFNVNFKSTVDFTEELYPMLSKDGKIIVTSTMYGKLQYQPKAAQVILSDESLTKERLFQLADEFIRNCEISSKDLVFNNLAMFTSKAFLNAYVRFVATKYIKPDQSIFAVHPGWVKTDLGGSKAPLTTDYACPFLANVVAQFPFGKHPLSTKLQFENKDIGY